MNEFTAMRGHEVSTTFLTGFLILTQWLQKEEIR